MPKIVRLSFALLLATAPSAFALDPDQRGEPSGLPASSFGGIPTRIIVGSNPDSQKGFSDVKTKNPIGFLVDVGGYGEPTFSGLSIPEAITGAMNIPADAKLNNHGAGVSGYSRSASPSIGAVGLYGQGDAVGLNTTAWGFNTVSKDNGIRTTGLWGGEIDINVTAAGTFARGLDIVGGSTEQPDVASPAIIVQTPGVGFKGKTKPIRWGRGLYLDDESAFTGIEVGTAYLKPSVGSMPISFMYRGPKNERGEAFRAYSSGPDGVIEVSAPNALLLLRGDVGGVKQNNLIVHGKNLGIGAGAPGLPTYPLDVYGAARFTGPVGFGGVKPVSRPKLPPAATDGASTMALVNAIRAAMIANGLAE